MRIARRRLICAAALPALLPAAAGAFRLEALGSADAEALQAGCRSAGMRPEAALAALRQAHAAHPLPADRRKMMEEGAL